jgi:hypothetical protein
VILCIERTSAGKEFVKAYGSVRIPTQPGEFIKEVRMFSEIDQNSLLSYFGLRQPAVGVPCEKVNPEQIANPEGRELSRVLSTGVISV